jgi:branched-chain amino acid transport system substrate-binding protein
MESNDEFTHEPAADPGLPVDAFLHGVLTRRRLMLGAFGTAVAAALAACGSSTKSSTPAATSAPTASAATNAPAATAAASTAATAGPAATTAGTTVAAGTGAITNAAKFGGGGADGTIKLGFTTPLTGPLGGFGEANEFILKGVNDLLKDGLMVGGKSFKVEILQRDTESKSDTAATQAGKLITDDKVDMMLAIATPEMINPSADQCEANGVPCLSTLAPWQPYFFGRNGDPAKGFDWTYHFFWGADQLVGVFTDLWNTIPTNKVIGMLCPNDPDGNALADAKTGFPAGIAGAGYTLVDGGRYNTLSDDFSTMIGQFKAKGAEALVGIPIPPDFATFWTQAAQQGWKPKVVTIAKAVLFPAAIESLPNNIGDGVSSEVWWTPSHPFSSSLTGASAKKLADDYTAATGKQWTQFVGFVHALLEVALDVISRAGSKDKKALQKAIGETDLKTIVGPVSYGKKGLPKNISTTPLVGGQWQKTSGGKYPYDLVIVSNTQAPEIPVGGKLKPIA